MWWEAVASLGGRAFIPNPGGSVGSYWPHLHKLKPIAWPSSLSLIFFFKLNWFIYKFINAPMFQRHQELSIVIEQKLGEKKFSVRFEPSTKTTRQHQYSSSLPFEPPVRFLMLFFFDWLFRGWESEGKRTVIDLVNLSFSNLLINYCKIRTSVFWTMYELFRQAITYIRNIILLYIVV